MVAAGQGAENLGACFNSHGRGGLGAGKLKNAHPTRMAVAGQGAGNTTQIHPTRTVLVGRRKPKNHIQLAWLWRASGGKMNERSPTRMVAAGQGKPTACENTRFLFPRRPSGGPANTCENIRFLLPRRPPGGPNCAKNNMVIALQQAAWGPTFKMMQGVCSPRGCREARHL